MRVLILSDAAPNSANASRFSGMARALAKRGHAVLSLMPQGADAKAGSATPLPQIPAVIAAQNWKGALHLTLPRQSSPLEKLTRASFIPMRLRSQIDRWLGDKGDDDSGWLHSAQAAQQAVLDGFRPDILWAGFGSQTNLQLAQQYAQAASVPMVIDVDGRDHGREQSEPLHANAVTGAAKSYAPTATKYFGKPLHCIRSGIETVMQAPAQSTARQDRFVVTLNGPIGSADGLNQFIKGLTRWVAQGGAARVSSTLFHYSGPDHHDVRAAVAHIGLECVASVGADLPPKRHAELLQDGAVNAYVNTGEQIHPEAFNLIAARRPQICVPSAHKEVVAIARDMGGGVRNCTNADAVVRALDSIWTTRQRRGTGKAPAANHDLTPLLWDTSAARLEALFADQLGRIRSDNNADIRAR